MNNKKPYPKIYYEMRLQQMLRELVEEMDEMNLRYHGRKVLCEICYQKHCICLLPIESECVNSENSPNLNGFDETDSVKINGYQSDVNEMNGYNGVFQFNGDSRNSLRSNGDCGVKVQSPFNLNALLISKQFKLNGDRRNDHNLDSGSEDDEPITFYSKLIAPPASLLLEYIRAERMNEGNLGPKIQNLKKRLDMIHNLNVDDWLTLLDEVDNSLADSVSVSSIDDDNASAIIKPIQPPSKEIADADRPNAENLENEEDPTMNGSFTHDAVDSQPSTSTATVPKSLENEEEPTMNGSFAHGAVDSQPSTSTATVPKSSRKKVITKYYSLFG